MTDVTEQARRQAGGLPRAPLHKRSLVAQVARRTSLTRAQVGEALEGILEVVAETMAAGGAVTLVGFGRFEARAHRPRSVRGLDRKSYRVAGRRVATFRAYPSLRARVQAQAGDIPDERGETCREQRTLTPRG
ncbi:MAG TPA: HU family DNA-binding protein [Anaerolineae bacterium]|nr:HU family DNA-binding protein [Anaerolineae bacterium]